MDDNMDLREKNCLHVILNWITRAEMIDKIFKSECEGRALSGAFFLFFFATLHITCDVCWPL